MAWILPSAVLGARANAHLFFVVRRPSTTLNSRFALKSRIWKFRYWSSCIFEKKLTKMSGNPFFEQMLVFSKTRLFKSWQNCFYPIQKKIIFLESLSDALNTILEKKNDLNQFKSFFCSIFDFSRKPLVLSIWQARHFGFSLFMDENVYKIQVRHFGGHFK